MNIKEDQNNLKISMRMKRTRDASSKDFVWDWNISTLKCKSWIIFDHFKGCEKEKKEEKEEKEENNE
jgi:DNA-binding cell septation regulator SpoVG